MVMVIMTPPWISWLWTLLWKEISRAWLSWILWPSPWISWSSSWILWTLPWLNNKILVQSGGFT